jgi:hypothetical protein
MLRKEQNDLLTQTGRTRRWGGCSAATGFRRCCTEELPENDCPAGAREAALRAADRVSATATDATG